MAKDPVRGMAVKERQAPGQSEYLGQTYFCSPSRKQQFDQNPQHDVDQQATRR